MYTFRCMHADVSVNTHTVWDWEGGGEWMDGETEETVQAYDT